MELENSLFKVLKHIIGPGTEKMLGDGNRGACSLFQYQLKNAKPIKAVLTLPPINRYGYLHAHEGIEPLFNQSYKTKNCEEMHI